MKTATKNLKSITILGLLMSVFILSSLAPQSASARKKGPPFNDEGPGGSGKRVVMMTSTSIS